MHTIAKAALLAMLALATRARQAAHQEIVDCIVARIENDVILLSDVRELSRYQQFVDGKAEGDSQVLDRLIDQWIVRTEADVARFPYPAAGDIDRGVERLKKSLGSAQEYEARKKQCSLNDQEIRAMVAAQLYLSTYLDSRFRPAVRIEPKAVEEFYENALVPRAKARGQEPPSLEASRDYIEEALVQEGINSQAEQWLKESRARLHIEKLLDEGAK